MPAWSAFADRNGTAIRKRPYTCRIPGPPARRFPLPPARPTGGNGRKYFDVSPITDGAGGLASSVGNATPRRRTIRPSVARMPLRSSATPAAPATSARCRAERVGEEPFKRELRGAAIDAAMLSFERATMISGAVARRFRRSRSSTGLALATAARRFAGHRRRWSAPTGHANGARRCRAPLPWSTADAITSQERARQPWGNPSPTAR